MRLIGLCGRSGSGKGVFCSLASQNGFFVIDCDKVYKELVSYRSPCLLEIADNFGKEVIKDDSLDRRYLAPIVFSDPEKLRLLNRITHKYVTSEVQNIISSLAEDALVILDAPALFESGMDELCELIVGVIAPDEACIERIIARDGISREEAVLRLSKQRSAEAIIESSDCIVYNESTIEDFYNGAKSLLTEIKEGSV